MIPITLSSDFDQTREKWIKDPTEYLRAVHLSPNGDRLALTARGRVFVAPQPTGKLVEITRKHGVRYSDARFLSDKSRGELEFWKAPGNGVGELQALTTVQVF